MDSIRHLRSRSRLALVALTLAAPFLLAPGSAAAQPPDPTGDWEGRLQVPGAQLRLVFHIGRDAEGLTATMDSPDQGALGIPAGRPELRGDTLVVPVPGVGGGYRGVLRGDTLTGEWSQSGQSLPLTLVRGGVEPTSAPDRPQHPEPPYPYRVEEVRFANEAAGVELAGTLTLPDGEGPFPAVALVSGSGPQTRDEEVAGHRVFHVLADHLTRRGIAVLRYDDRGVGESTGDFAAATSEDFAGDAGAAAAFLRRHPAVDAGAVGLLGHSEGGLVAPMVARSDPDLAFLVLLAGPGVDGAEVLVSQSAAMQRAQGVPEAQIEANGRAIRSVAEVLATRPREAWADEVRAALLASVPPGMPEAQVQAAVDPQVRQLTSPWMAFFLNYDPVPALEALDVPVLALFGGLDLQVLPEVNLPPMRAALGDRAGVAVEEMAGLNHLFQPAATGLPSEYAGIETTMAPAALERIAAWILEVGTGRGG